MRKRSSPARRNFPLATTRLFVAGIVSSRASSAAGAAVVTWRTCPTPLGMGQIPIVARGWLAPSMRGVRAEPLVARAAGSVGFVVGAPPWSRESDRSSDSFGQPQRSSVNRHPDDRIDARRVQIIDFLLRRNAASGGHLSSGGAPDGQDRFAIGALHQPLGVDVRVQEFAAVGLER